MLTSTGDKTGIRWRILYQTFVVRYDYVAGAALHLWKRCTKIHKLSSLSSGGPRAELRILLTIERGFECERPKSAAIARICGMAGS